MGSVPYAASIGNKQLVLLIKRPAKTIFEV